MSFKKTNTLHMCVGVFGKFIVANFKSHIKSPLWVKGLLTARCYVLFLSKQGNFSASNKIILFSALSLED